MPKSVERCVSKLKKQGKKSDNAWAICQASYNKSKKKSSTKKSGKKK